MSPENDEPRTARGPVREDHVHVVRTGHGANCSSIGSVIDTLFAAATIGAAVFAAVAAALSAEDIKVVPRDDAPGPHAPTQHGESP